MEEILAAVSPSVADKVTELVWKGMEFAQTAGPYSVGSAAVGVGAAIVHDRISSNGISSTMASREMFTPVSGEKSRIRHIGSKIGSVLLRKDVWLPFTIPLAVTTFALAAEENVRNGQVDTLRAVGEMIEEGAGFEGDLEDAVFITQGGVDTSWTQV